MMDKFESQTPEGPGMKLHDKHEAFSIKDHEKHEAFTIEKWKLSHEKSQKILDIVERAESIERKEELSENEQNLERTFQALSLDEKAEFTTKKDIQSTNTLIAEIENRFPELKMFAEEQYS